jgi:hypothetical protein
MFEITKLKLLSVATNLDHPRHLSLAEMKNKPKHPRLIWRQELAKE